MSWTAVGKDGVSVQVPDGMTQDDPRIAQLFAEKRAEEKTKDVGPVGAMGKLLYGGAENLVQGAGQLVGLGPDDKAVAEKRAYMEALKKKTDMGIAPDWAPTLGSVAEFAGETAPLLIPGLGQAGMAGRVAAAAPRLARTMEAIGGAAKAVPGVGRAAEAYGAMSPVAQAATAGAVQGAAQPLLSDESRVGRGLEGAAVGSVLQKAVPVLMRLPGKVSNESRAEGRLLKTLQREAEVEGPKAGMTPDQYVETMKGKLNPMGPQRQFEDQLKESAATRMQSPGVAALEKETGSTEAVLPSSRSFNKDVNEAQVGVLEQGFEAPGTVKEAKAARDAAASTKMNEAYDAANTNRVDLEALREIDPVNQFIKDQYGANPNVKTVTTQVQTYLDALKEGQGGEPHKILDPAEHLHNLRKQLTDALYSPTQLENSALQVAAKDKMARGKIQQLIKSIDDTLDSASSGKWGEWKNVYESQSRGVEAARSARTAQETITPDLGKTMTGEVPEIKLGPLRQAMKNEQRSRFSPEQSAFAPDTEAAIQAVGRNINRAGGPAATAAKPGQRFGETAEQTADTRARDAFKGVVRSFARPVVEWAQAGRNKELWKMLENPEAALTAINMAQRARRPLTETQQELLKYFSQYAAHGATEGR